GGGGGAGAENLGVGAAWVVSDELLHDLGEGVVGDRLAVGEAAADGHRRDVAQLVEELLCEPRLADPRRPRDRAEPAGALVARTLEGFAELLQALLAAHERRRMAPREPLR